MRWIMNIEKLRNRGGSVTHSHFSVEFDAIYPNWTEFMSNLGKQLDELEFKMSEVSKLTWEHGFIQLDCIRIFEVKEGKIRRIEWGGNDGK